MYVHVSTSRHKCRGCSRLFPIGKDRNEVVCPKCGSTDVDRAGDREVQVLRLRQLAQQLEATTMAEYIDVGGSGSKDHRPALTRLSTDASARKFDAVVVAGFDHFPSTRHLVIMLEEFSGLDIRFVSFAEGLDTSALTAHSLFTLISGLAELERSLVREQVRAAYDRAKRRGTHLGRPRPGVDEAAVCEQISQGRSINSVAKQFRVSRGTIRTIAARGGVEWDRSTRPKQSPLQSV